MITGGCYCGAIRYGIDDGQYVAADCHCTMCRRIHAAPYVSWLVVPVEQFRYSKGEVTELKSSTTGKRFYCQACGTHIACTNEKHPEIIDITIGSLDDPEIAPPKVAVFEDTRLSWVPHTQES